MKHTLVISLLAWAALVQAEPAPPVIPAEPAEAAKAFYSALRDLKVDGLPTGMTWLALKPRVTEELATAIFGAQAEQSDFIKNHPDEKPPWVEGDLFSSLFEGPQKLDMGEAKITGDQAEVPVTCTHTEGADTTKWTDTLILRKSAKGWLLDDVRYGGTWEFAPKGTLKQSFAPGGN